MVETAGPSDPTGLVACPDCDLLGRRVALAHGQQARCARCGALLYRRIEDVVNRVLALALASLMLFTVANAFPFMEFEIAGRVRLNYLVTGITELHAEGFAALAVVVAVTSVAAPLAMIAMLLYVTLPLRLGRRPPGLQRVLKIMERVRPWSMMEVYMLGVVVAVIKLSQMAEIEVGPALYAFTGLILVLTAALAQFDQDVFWDAVEPSA